MQRRRVGSLELSPLGLGTSRLASLGSGRSKSDGRRLLAAARGCGINVLDTADTYGSTAAERWIGEFTARDPGSWVVVTKTGLPTADLPGPFRVLNQPVKKVMQACDPRYRLDPATLRRNIEGSLRRLRRERIEIFLLHLPPTGIVNDLETLAALRDARSSGLIAEFGVASEDLTTMRDVHENWGRTWMETTINPTTEAGRRVGALEGLDVIASHVMAPSDDGGLAYGGRKRSLEPRVGGRPDGGPTHRALLRHAAAIPGVKVVLTGTSDPRHLEANAAALAAPATDADLLC